MPPRACPALARDIRGVGFATADQVALKLGVAADSAQRVGAAMAEVLREAAESGDTALPLPEATERLRELLAAPPATVTDAIEREREGMSQRESLLEACRERARPIVMTTMAMAAGMLPTAFALEKGAEFRQPMAVAVIGGLLTSTVLSLVLVPVVYEFVDDFEQWLKPRLARLVTPAETVSQSAPEDRF